MQKKTLIVDFDGVVAHSMKAMCSYYNYIFYNHSRFIEADHEKGYYWNLNKQCPLFTSDIVENMFGEKRFFKYLELMPNCKEVLELLKEKYNIYLLTIGSLENIAYKCKFIKENGLYDCFDGFHFHDKKNNKMSKSFFNMENCIFLDDNEDNLFSVKHYQNVRPIRFGREYDFNRNWKGEKCSNWLEVKRKLL